MQCAGILTHFVACFSGPLASVDQRCLSQLSRSNLSTAPQTQTQQIELASGAQFLGPLQARKASFRLQIWAWPLFSQCRARWRKNFLFGLCALALRQHAGILRAIYVQEAPIRKCHLERLSVSFLSREGWQQLRLSSVPVPLVLGKKWP